MTEPERVSALCKTLLSVYAQCAQHEPYASIRRSIRNGLERAGYVVDGDDNPAKARLPGHSYKQRYPDKLPPKVKCWIQQIIDEVSPHYSGQLARKMIVWRLRDRIQYLRKGQPVQLWRLLDKELEDIVDSVGDGGALGFWRQITFREIGDALGITKTMAMYYIHGVRR